MGDVRFQTNRLTVVGRCRFNPCHRSSAKPRITVDGGILRSTRNHRRLLIDHSDRELLSGLISMKVCCRDLDSV